MTERTALSIALELRERLAGDGQADLATTADEIVAALQVKPQAPVEQTELKLIWPTDYRVVTQRFGMRPEYYGQFGLPGHEGLDIRAPNGANIYAAADGVVSLVAVDWRAGTGNPKRRADHPYGYHVRVRHKRVDGEFETIYAHGQEGTAKVEVGDTVVAGQLLVLGDSTGNVSGAHLHFSLVKLPGPGETQATSPAGLKASDWFRYQNKIFVNPERYGLEPA